MIKQIDSEEYLDDFVEEYVKFGINVTNHRTKLGKRVYLMICLTSLLILFFDILEDDSEIKKSLNDFIKSELLLTIFIGIVLLGLIILLPERNNLTIIFVIFIWVCWLLYFSCLFSFLLKYWPLSNFSYAVFTIHHFIILIYCLFREEFDFYILYANLILSIFGIIFILIQKFWIFPDVSYLFLLCLQYFLVNIFYFLLVQYFMNFHQKKFWRRRKGFTFFLIFILANFTIILVFFICFYVFFLIFLRIFKNPPDDDSENENTGLDIDVFSSKKP
jgi:hypothetical protein